MSDTELILLFHQGNKEAFTEIFYRYNHYVFIVAVKVLHDRQEAHDCVQDVFVKLWEHREQLSADACIKNYMGVVARNTALDILQKQKNSRRLTVAGEQVEYPDFMQHKERQQALAGYLGKLRPIHRQALTLKYLLGMRQREIAKLLGYETQTIAKRISVALHQLRKQPKPAL